MLGMQIDYVRSLLENRINSDEETGATMIEYVLMVSLIALVAVGAVQILGDSTEQRFDDANTCLNTPTAAVC